MLFNISSTFHCSNFLCVGISIITFFWWSHVEDFLGDITPEKKYIFVNFFDNLSVVGEVFFAFYFLLVFYIYF